MQPVKNFVFAVLLVSSLAFSTFAGEQDTPGYVPPPPPPRQEATINEDPTITSGIEPDGGIVNEPSDYSFLGALVALLSVY